jgi:hypothetical protein
MFLLAQESFAQTFRAKAGLNLSNILDKDDSETYSTDYKMQPGFNVGATAEFPLNEMFSVETGLYFLTKGYKFSDSGSEFGYEWKEEENVNLYYLDIPITGKASFDAGGAKIFGVLGPYIGIGLSGKAKYEYTFGGDSESGSEDIEWGSGEDDHLKRFDFGLTAGAGAEIKSFQIIVSYSYGLANISADTEGGYKVNNRVLGISLGYKFGGE